MNRIIRTFCICILLVILGVFVYVQLIKKPVSIIPPSVPPTTVQTTPPKVVDDTPAPEGSFRSVVLGTTKPATELADLVGKSNVSTVLAINHIDSAQLKQNIALIIPTSFDNPRAWEFMPPHIDGAETIEKMIIVSQRTQSFGAYEQGMLVRSGPVSSGKQSTPTKNGLYFTNWKGKEVISTVSDEWILKWNFNIDNLEGISLHQYELPGYPASHSCVRLYAADAEWNYNWSDQWVVSADGQTKLASGTPVIIYGAYDFKGGAPWKKLPTDPTATTVTKAELEDLVATNLAKIHTEALNRSQVIAQ